VTARLHGELAFRDACVFLNSFFHHVRGARSFKLKERTDSSGHAMGYQEDKVCAATGLYGATFLPFCTMHRVKD
jgi:hypothetical protein